MHPEEIKAGMRMKGTTPAMLADELGVSSASMSQVIAGSIRSERIQNAIARVLGRPVSAIWPDKPRLRRSRAEMLAARAAKAVSHA